MRWLRRTVLYVLLVIIASTLTPRFAVADDADDRGMLQRFTYTSVRGTNPYLVYTPRSYHRAAPGQSASLVVMVHGCNTTALEQANASAWHALAERERFVVVYPDNTNEVRYLTDNESDRPARWVGSHPVQCWRWYDPTSNLRDSGDVAQVAGITREVMANWKVDPERVYVVGMSSGAMLTSMLGATYPDLFTAIGVVAGCAYLATACGGNDVNNQLESPELQARAAYAAMGEHARVVPVIEMHGDQDTTVYPAEGRNAVRQWLMTNNLVLSGDTGGPFDLTPGATQDGREPSGYAWSRDSYTDRDGCLVSEHWRIHEMGHFWPGGSEDPQWAEWTDWRAPSGAEATWAFFSRFRKSSTDQRCVGNKLANGSFEKSATPARAGSGWQ